MNAMEPKWRIETKMPYGEWTPCETAMNLPSADAYVRIYQCHPFSPDYKFRIVHHSIPTEAVYE